MRRFRFRIAVAVTSLALVLLLAGTGAVLVRNTVANGPWSWGHRYGPGFGGPGFELPEELQSLRDLAPEERFAHFRGAQINLTDAEDQPVRINLTPGMVTAASATSLSIAANDGSAKTFTLDDQTMIRSKGVRGGDEATEPALAQDDKVVVVTLNDSTTATAVMNVGTGGFGWGHR